MTTELLRSGYSSISCTEDRCTFIGAVMPTELQVLILRKKDKMFLKKLQLFFNLFVGEKRKLCLNTKGAFRSFLYLLMGHGDLTLWSHCYRYY